MSPLTTDADAEVRTFASWGAGARLYTNRQARQSLDEKANAYQTSQADTTLSTAAVAGLGAVTADTDGYGPSAMEGEVTGAAPFTAALLGDSILQGAGDLAGTTVGDASGCMGWAERALEGACGVVNVSQSGKRTSDFNASSKRVMSLIGGRCSHVLAELGYNDLNGHTLAASQAAARTMWRTLADAGLKVIVSTHPATTSSTNGWTTLAGQSQGVGTAWVSGGVASQFNDWLRAGAGGSVATACSACSMWPT